MADTFRSAMLLALSALARVAAAQHAGPRLEHYHHTAWLEENGPPLPGVHQLMRSPDGYLWIGARGGLMRFDGVRFAIIDSTVAPALKSSAAGSFLPQCVDRDGWLWFSRPDGGLVQYRDGQFRVVHQPDVDVGRFATIDRAGQIWLRGLDAHLRVWRNGRAERPLLPPGVPDTGLTEVVRDTGQGIWIGTRTQGLWHVVGSRAERVPPLDPRQPSIRPLRQTSDGSVWALVEPGLHRIVHGQWLPVSLPVPGRPFFNAPAVVEDSDHGVWIATVGHGVLRWRDGIFEQFSKEHGLSDVSVDDLLPGEDGSMWIATASGGLDQLRPTPFITLDRRGGLPFESAYRFVEDESGSLWGRALGQSIVVELRGGLVDGNAGAVRATPASLPLNHTYEVLRGARGGGVWLGPYTGGLLHYRHGTVTRWTERDGLPTKRLGYAVETRDGALWLGTVPNGGFGRLRNGKFLPIALPGDPHARVKALAEDGRGHLWVAAATFVYELIGDSVVRRLGPAGWAGQIAALTLERGDTLWGITVDSGIVRIASGRAAFVRTPMLRRLLGDRPGVTASESHLWIVGAGVARLSLAALHAVADGKRGTITPRFFLESDGIASPRNAGNSPVPSFRARDGRVWISTPAGLAVVDPSRQFIDSSPPILHVEELSSSGRIIPRDGPLEVPPHPSNVSIQYTAISLSSGERTRIQYRLDGADESWIDAAGPRVATYTQLRPGTYTFRMRAWNVDGVPSTHDETLIFRVLPAWYETTWSRLAGILLIALAGAMGAIVVQRRRAGRAAEIMRSQFEATLTERTRIARELHDTLLQGFTGITIQLRAIQRVLQRRPEEGVAALEAALTTADTTLRDARHTIWDMKAVELEGQNLPEALEGAVRSVLTGASVALHFTVRGDARPLRPDLETTALRIGREAVLNALKHADPRKVEVSLEYDAKFLRLEIRDYGRGMDKGVAEAAAANGHLGIGGMRARAHRAAGTMEIASEPGRGTIVRVSLPIAS